MSFQRDAEIIEDVVLHRDPSFGIADRPRLTSALAELNRSAGNAARDTFLLAAMRVVALGRNAHSRVIPNLAIKVLPLRIVALGQGWQVTQGPVTGTLLGIGGLPVEEVANRLLPYLAGPPARQRVIGGIALAWPAALRVVGAMDGTDCRFDLRDSAGNVKTLTLSTAQCVQATQVFPLQEQGYPIPGSDPFAATAGLPGNAIHLRFSTFFDGEGTTLEDLVRRAADTVRKTDANLIIDLRGNTGGSFLTALPLLEVLRSNWQGDKCAVLVDKFTFSAAIVFAALLSYHLKGQARLFGEPMGDDPVFWAEGGTIDLPDSGAQLRWSDGYHDWRNGDPENSAPAEFAHHMVPAGDICIVAGGPQNAGLPAAALKWLGTPD